MSVIDHEKLSMILAGYAGITEEEAKRFLDAFSFVISEHVRSGEDVEVQGLGRFFVVDTKQAEMRRVALMLSESMKDEVNSPFSFLEPYVISKGGNSDNVEDVKIEGTEDIDEVVESTELVEISEAFESKEDEDEIVEAIETEETQDEVSCVDPMLGVALVKTDSKHKGMARKYFFIVLSILIGVFIVLYAISCLVHLVTRTEKEPVMAESSFNDSYDNEENVKEELVIEEVIEEPLDTVITIVLTNTEEKKPTVFNPHYKLDSIGNPECVVMQVGERLTLISLRYFGSKDFWPYIFDVNSDKLKSPSNVVAGLKLYLPDPAYYDINSDDEQSLKKARQRGKNILTNR